MPRRTLTRSERADYARYLRQCTAAQVQGCYSKERHNGNHAELTIIRRVAADRGIVLDHHDTYTFGDF